MRQVFVLQHQPLQGKPFIKLETLLQILLSKSDMKNADGKKSHP